MTFLELILSPLRGRVSGKAAAHERFLAELAENGYFEGLTTPEIELLRENVKQYGVAGIYGAPRCIHADSEDIAEGQLSRILDEVGPLLARFGVPQLTVSEDFSEFGYSLELNSRRYVIWTTDEAENAWGLSEVRTLMLLNDLLGSAHSGQRAYGLYGGNDFHIFILTPRLRDLLASQPGVRPKDRPYEASEHPLFHAAGFQSASR